RVWWSRCYSHSRWLSPPRKPPEQVTLNVVESFSILLILPAIEFIYHLDNAVDLRHVSGEDVIRFLFTRGQIVAGTKRKNPLKRRLLTMQNKHGPKQSRKTCKAVAHQVG